MYIIKDYAFLSSFYSPFRGKVLRRKPKDYAILIKRSYTV